MVRAATLSRKLVQHTEALARVVIVSGCALALITAGRALPF